MRPLLLFAGAIWIGVLAAGCGPRHDIVISHLTVTPAGWDSLHIAFAFAEQARFGDPDPVSPDSFFIHVFDAAYDTLYAGTERAIAVDDAALGSNERVSIDVCGIFAGMPVCQQASVLASPKRVLLTPEFDYPREENVQRGAYRLPFVVERQVFGTDEWETLRLPRRPAGRVVAYVEGRENASVAFAFARESGNFDLGHDANYRDFKFALDSALRNSQEAAVRFDIFVDLEGVAAPLQSVVRHMRTKTREEREEEVARYAEWAADRVIEVVNPFVDNRRSVAFIDNWQYNAITRRYTVLMEISWSGSTFVRSTYRLEGQLEVDESGENATFLLTAGDRRGMRRWESRLNDARLELGTLQASFRRDGFAGGVYAFDGELLVIEAEAYDEAETVRGHAWRRDAAPRGFVGEGAVAVQPNEGLVIEAPGRSNSPALVYPVVFDAAGTYYVWIRMWAEDSASNSVHIGLDDEPQRGASRIESQRYRGWYWTGDRRGVNGRARIDVDSPGMHSLHLWMREDGVVVDRILLTPNARYIPRDEGPVESERIMEDDEAPEEDVSIVPGVGVGVSGSNR